MIRFLIPAQIEMRNHFGLIHRQHFSQHLIFKFLPSSDEYMNS